MARINIEDSIFKDERFIQLCIKTQSSDTALGALVRAWSLAQKWYLTEDRMIPLSDWKKQKINNLVIDVGLAEIKGDKVKVEGADEQFAWLLQRVEAGRKGGQAKGKQDQDLDLKTKLLRNGARTILNKAVSSGKIEKPICCFDCGAKDCIIEGHHSDYEKPLDVIWLCKKCHTETHRNIREASADLAKRPLADAKPPLLTLTPPLSLFSDSSSNSNSNSNSNSEEIKKANRKPKQPSKAQPLGCIAELNLSDTVNELFSRVAQETQRAWLEAYPNPKWICHEALRAKIWIIDNPKKAPKKFGGFFSRWLGNSYESQRKGIPSNKKTYQQQNADANDALLKKYEQELADEQNKY